MKNNTNVGLWDIKKIYKEKTILIKQKPRKIKQIDIESIGKGVD